MKAIPRLTGTVKIIENTDPSFVPTTGEEKIKEILAKPPSLIVKTDIPVGELVKTAMTEVIDKNPPNMLTRFK